MAFLEVENLRSGYGKIEVLQGISIAIEAGEFVAIVGANGVGKTTLLRTISGIVRARAGYVRFDGVDVTNRPAHRVPELRIAHVPEGRQIFAQLTVRENLLTGAYLNRDAARRKAQLAYVLSLFPRLEERLAQPGGSLSGGEQQMLAIGRALMLEPKLLFLDEPSQGLSPRIVEEMYRLLRAVHQAGTTIVLVEQNVEAAFRVATRAYVVDGGRVVLAGTSEELRGNENVIRAYMGV